MGRHHRSLATLLCATLGVCLVSASHFDEWLHKHGRRYRTPEERAYRRGVYEANEAFVEKRNTAQHNDRANAFELRLNAFADMTQGEWASRFTGGYVPGEGDWDPQGAPAGPGQGPGGQDGAGGDAAIGNPTSAPDGLFQPSPSIEPYAWPWGPNLPGVPTPTKGVRRLGGSQARKQMTVGDLTPAPPAPAPLRQGTASPSFLPPPSILAPTQDMVEGDAGQGGNVGQGLSDAMPTPTPSASASQVGDVAPVEWGFSHLWPWGPSSTPTPRASPSPVYSPSATPFPARPTAAVATGTAAPVDNGRVEPLTPLPPDLPASVDWSLHPLLQGAWPIRNQGGCGACYAFATIGAIEGALNIRDAAQAQAKGETLPTPTGPRYSLAEQMVLDCSANTCAGGGIRVTWRSIVSTGGLCSSSAYPYTAEKGACAPSCSDATKQGNITGYTNIQRQDEVSLLRALASGPVVVAIQADQQSFMFYSKGVLDDEGCGTALNHAVVAVGYGVEPSTGQAYFKLRNSWGPGWGEGGYIRIARGGRYNPAGQCGVQMDPTTPILA